MTKKLLATLVVCFVLALVLPLVALSQGAAAKDGGAVAAVTKLENDAVKADLAGDASFYEKNLADDWTGGTSRGTWDTKQSMLADMRDTKNNKTNSENISDLKVRAHGDVAIATATSTYDSLIQGKHYARTIITTDVWQRRNGAWKQIATHASLVKE